MTGFFIFLALILVYYLTGTHQKVLSYFGLSQRDDKLMWIGVFLPGFITAVCQLVVALVTLNSAAILGPLIWGLLYGALIYMNYKSL